MKAQIIHHTVTLALVAPLLLITGFVSVKSPTLLNPWNGELLGGFWIVVLPALISSFGITINAGIGLFHSLRQSSQARPQ